MSFSVIDILFLVTVVLMVLSGLRNGAVFSLINLLSIPVALGVAYFFGPQFTAFLASNNLAVSPLISYIVLFFGTVVALHALGNSVRRFVRSIPLVSSGDALLGAVIGFGEAWLLWLFLLIVLGSFLNSLQGTVNTVPSGAGFIPGANVQIGQLKQWHDLYNQAVTNSLFAKVNGFFIRTLPSLPQPPQ